MHRAGWRHLALLAALVAPAHAAKVADGDGAEGARSALTSRSLGRSRNLAHAWVSARGAVGEESKDGGRRQMMRAEPRESLSQSSGADQDAGDGPVARRDGRPRPRGRGRRRQRRRNRNAIDCVWGDWRPWSQCSSACGGGIQTRTRGESVAARGGGRACEGMNTEEEACDLMPCPVDCEWGTWGEWQACSASCGGGRMSRTRSASRPAAHGGRSCEGSGSQQQNCNTGICPVDCSWGDWGRWTTCTHSCGFGTTTRTRAPRLAIGGGKACEGPGNETIQCNTDPCPTSCMWADWKPWGSCSASCGNGTRMRRREKAREAHDGGSECQGSSREEGSCMDQLCMVDCQWSPWAAWPECPVTCGGGSVERNRSVTVAAENGGKQCEGSAREQVNCGVAGCPVNCVWTDWDRWSECTRTCGSGKTSRKRRKALEASNGGLECVGSAAESRECNHDECPVDCEWSQWSPWSNCSASCGGGQILRRRNVKISAAFGGRVCQGEREASVPCNTEGCPVDCVWSDWGGWEACTKTCGNGTSIRNRMVKVQSLFGGRPCAGNTRELVPCNTNACPVNCHWGEWGEWRPCSQSCGSGVRTRERAVLNPARDGGRDCPGRETAQADCNTQVCPVDCKWEPWNEWGPCPVTCGGSVLTRVRAKQTESNGGQPCVGNGNETKTCGEVSCSNGALTVTDVASKGSATSAVSATSATSAMSPSTTSATSTAGATSSAGTSSTTGSPVFASSSSTGSMTGTGNATPVETPITNNATASKKALEETLQKLPPANATGGQPRQVAGDVLISITNAPAFSADPRDKACLAKALALSAGIRGDSVTVGTLQAATPVMLLSVAQRLGMVEARYTVATDDISGEGITATFRHMNASKVTFFLEDALRANGIISLPEVVSITADMLNAPPAGSNGSSSASIISSSTNLGSPTNAGSVVGALISIPNATTAPPVPSVLPAASPVPAASPLPAAPPAPPMPLAPQAPVASATPQATQAAAAAPLAAGNGTPGNASGNQSSAQGRGLGLRGLWMLAALLPVLLELSGTAF